ncbi:MAG: hypothetical protein AB7F43_07570 [Bacteriovoracia bacterium]
MSKKEWLNKKRRQITLGLLSFFLTLPHCFANSIDTIHIDGGAPYQVVYEDKDDQRTNAEPGLYVRNDEAKANETPWKISIRGHLLSAPTKGGFHAMLSLSKLTHRYECVGIINNRPVLFSVQSVEQDKESFAVLGEGQNRVVNPVDHSIVQLPIIQNTKDVHFHEKSIEVESEKLQIVITSIRNPNGLNGDGITFASVLSLGECSGSKIKLKYPPILLDWNFHEPAAMADLIFSYSAGKYGLYSENLNRKLSVPNDDPYPVEIWKKRLSGLINGKTNRLQLYNVGLGFQIPSYNPITGNVLVPELPMTKIRLEDAHLLAIYDVIGKDDGIIMADDVQDRVSSDEVDELPFIIKGTPALNAAGEAISESKSSRLAVSGSISMLKMSDGKYYLVSSAAQDHLHFKPTRNAYLRKNPIAMSWVPINQSNYIVASWKFEDASFTSIYEFDNNHDDLRLVRSIELSDQYYNQQTLGARLSRYNDILLFDSHTKNVTSKDEYEALHRLTTPHIDVENSLKEKALDFYYPESLEREQISGRTTYMSFEKTEGHANRSGFYSIVHQGQKSPKLLLGEFLKPSDFEGHSIQSENGVLETAELDLNDGFGKAALQLVAQDPGFNRGGKLFQLNLIASPSSRDLQPVAMSVETIPSSFSKLDWVSIIVPEQVKPNNNQKYILVAYRNKDRGSFIHIISLGMGRRDLSLSQAHNTKVIKIAKQDEVMDAKEVRERIRFEENGNPFWVETPELGEDDIQFRLKNLRTGESVETNRVNVNSNFAKAQEGVGYSYHARGGWKAYIHDGSVREQTDKARHSNDYVNDIYNDIPQMFDDVVNSSKPARRLVILYPPELKSYFENYAMALLVRSENRLPNWSIQNRSLSLYRFNANKSTQIDFITNFQDMKSETLRYPSAKPVLIANLSEIKEAKRPKNQQLAGKSIHDYQIYEERIDKVDALAGASDDGMKTVDTVVPHAIYWSATEGEKVDIKDFPSMSKTPTVSSIFLGTRDEWEQVLADASFEEKYSISDFFEVYEIPPPSEEKRVEIVKDLLRRDEIRSYNYEIDVNSFEVDSGSSSKDKQLKVSKDPFDVVAEYFVRSAERYSKPLGLDPKLEGKSVFQGFNKALLRLGKELTTNTDIRRKKKISRGTIEGILAKDFPVPLNIELLDEDDPFRKVFDADAAFQWQMQNHFGNFIMKERFLKGVQNAFSAEDDVKKVAASFIIPGPSGTGKTTFITSFIDWLGLKVYRFNAKSEENQGAWAFVMNMSKIYDDTERTNTVRDSDMMSFTDAKAHLDRQLTSQNGWRSVYLFDDIHLAPPKVKAYFIARIRSMLESKKITIRNPESNRDEEIPTRHLIPVMTLNPVSNKEQQGKFGNTLNHKIMAALSNKDGSNDQDDSLIKRFGDVLTWTSPDESSMAPALIEQVVKTSKGEFNNRQRLTLVSTPAISLVAREFAKTDFRTFLSAASRSLTKPNIKGSNKFFIATLRRHDDEHVIPMESASKVVRHSEEEESSERIVSAKIEAFCDRELDFHPIGDSGRANLEFLRYTVDAFRKRTYELLLKSIQMSKEFSLGSMNQQFKAAPLIRAVYHHLKTFPYIPLEDLNLTPDDIGADSPTTKQNLRQLLESEVLAESISRIRMPAVGVVPSGNSKALFAATFSQAPLPRTRQHVLAEHVVKLQRFLERVLLSLARLDSVQRLPTPEGWLKQLTEKEADLVLKFGKEFTEIITQYNLEIYGSGLIENTPGSTAEPLSQYDALRLFLLVLDKAIARQAWGKVARFLGHSATVAIQTPSLGQKTAVLHYMFQSRTSLMVPMDLSIILDLAEYMPSFDAEVDPSKDVSHKEFMGKCAALLKPKKKGT